MNAETSVDHELAAVHAACRLDLFWKGLSPCHWSRSSSNGAVAKSGRWISIPACSRTASSSWVRPIDDTVANLIVAQMLVLAHRTPRPTSISTSTAPAGASPPGMAIYDTMQWVPCDVATYCIGQCASMGSLLLAAGAKGKRNALPHSRIMIHQPLAGMEGTATEILIHAEEFIRMKKQLNQIYQRHTGQTLEKLQEDTDRDRFMGPEEARRLRPDR